MLSSVTRRTIHEEARNPSFDAVQHVLKRRRAYLGHILRMSEDRTVRRYLTELSPAQRPFIPGSLLDDTDFRDINSAIDSARNREL